MNARLVLPPGELDMRAVRSSGPGGQNVNKVATAVELRFDVQNSQVLGEVRRARILNGLATRLVGEGVLVVRSSTFREQGRNLEDARQRLAELLRAALVVAKVRRPTKPTRGSQRRRAEAKRKRSSTKRDRRSGHED